MKSVHPCVSDDTFAVRAPGRVNLIGEHIDYNGYSVLPMALDQAVYIVASSIHDSHEKQSVRIISQSPEFPTFEETTDVALKVFDNGAPENLKWYHYVLCGYRGIYDFAREINSNWEAPSLCMIVDHGESSDHLPLNAGLSSSSALVVAAAMVTIRCAKISIDPIELASICAKCERLIGTHGGGMDQAACLLSHKSPILIEFTKPMLTISPTSIPSECTFVIADSGVRLNKAASPLFNERVSQCQDAIQLISRHTVGAVEKEDQLKLADLQHLCGKFTPGDMLGLLKDIKMSFTNEIDVILINRAEHVFAEAERVCDFKRICDGLSAQNLPNSGDIQDSSNDATLRNLGKLMNDSHDSCRDLYECSCDEVDRLVNICRAAGSLGSRLTGAGWGGCVVSLVRSKEVATFMEFVKRAYFGAMSAADLQTRLFTTKAGGAAGFINLMTDS